MKDSPAFHKCHHCDELLAVAELSKNDVAVCPVCGSTVKDGSAFTNEQLLCLSLTALILFLASLAGPFISINANGNENQLTLASSLIDVYQHDDRFLALLVAVCVLMIPLLGMTAVVGLLVMLCFGKFNRHFPMAFKVYRLCTSWMMVEVYIIGILVSLLKVGSLATVELGPSFYTYFLFVFCAAVVLIKTDPESLWERWMEGQRGNLQVK
jgi:paraquat-inducible protein A